MATTRAIEDLTFALIKKYTVKSGTAFSVGDRVILTSTEGEADKTTGASNYEIGTVYVLGHGAVAGVLTGDGTEAYQVDVVLDGNVIRKFKVGTGGTTRGKPQMMSGSSDGITDAPANGGGTTGHRVIGIAVNGGVAGDYVGVLLTPGFMVGAT